MKDFIINDGEMGVHMVATTRGEEAAQRIGQRKCRWKHAPEDEDNEGEQWKAMCGENNLYEFTTDAEDNRKAGFRFCPYCGGKILWGKRETE